MPQLTRNIPYKGEAPLENVKVKKAIQAAEGEINGYGRLVVRASGTEPVIQIMAEAEDLTVVERVVGRIAASVEACRSVWLEPPEAWQLLGGADPGKRGASPIAVVLWAVLRHRAASHGGGSQLRKGQERWLLPVRLEPRDRCDQRRHDGGEGRAYAEAAPANNDQKVMLASPRPMIFLLESFKGQRKYGRSRLGFVWPIVPAFRQRRPVCAP